MSESYVKNRKAYLAKTLTWDMSYRENRAEVRRARRWLWWARYGRYASVVIGALFGNAIAVALLVLTRGWWS